MVAILSVQVWLSAFPAIAASRSEPPGRGDPAGPLSDPYDRAA